MADTGSIRHGDGIRDTWERGGSLRRRVGARLEWLSAALLVLSLVAGRSGAQVKAAPAALVQPGSQSNTDGVTVVWVNQGVYAARPGQQPVLIAADPTLSYSYPGVAGDLVVWQQDCAGSDCPPTTMNNIQAKNLATGQRIEVGRGARPHISDTTVLYLGGAGLMLRDLASTAAPVTVATADPGWSLVDSRIAGGRIAWAEEREADKITTVRIMADKLGQAPELVDEGIVLSFFGLDLAGDELVYVDGPDAIVARDLASGRSVSIPANPYDQQPTTNGRYVFWERSNFGPGSNQNGDRHDIVGYDLRTGSPLSVAANAGLNHAPVARGGLLVWVHGEPPNSEVHAVSIAGVLPTAPLPNPGTTSPDWTYFPETSHYLAHGFRACWQASGGLAIFGYPLTEEFEERDPGTGHTNVVQYSERARFEYPGDGYSSGAPCNPWLGRVGAELAQARGLATSAPFQRLPGDTAGDANCQFFAESGHRLCFGFRAFWQSHGLEFGDDETAYWKSVALFGYPISEEFTDPATGLTVQYFERARFEYHPKNLEGYRVELGRVGAELLSNDEH